MVTLDQITWVFGGGGLELMREFFGRYNMHYVITSAYTIDSGFRTNKPLRTLDNFKGMSLRTPGAQPMWILEQIGAKPVKIAGGEIYMALKLGTIDGAEFGSPSADWGMKFYEMTKYWNLPGWNQAGSLFGCMVNREAWNALPDDLKDAFEIAARATVTDFQAWLRMEDARAVQFFEDYGTETVRLDEESFLALEDLTIKYWEMKAAESADYARVLKSQMDFLKLYEGTRNIEDVYGYGRNLTRYPDIPGY